MGKEDLSTHPPPSSFFAKSSLNTAISYQNFLNFSVNPFDALL